MKKIETIGQRIKYMREVRKMTRKELGLLLELNNPDIRVGAYENDKKFPRMAMVDKIANVLGVSSDWLLTGRFDYETAVSLIKENQMEVALKLISETDNEIDKFINYFIMNAVYLTKTDYKVLYNCLSNLIKRKEI